jgi:hypothetical protein
MSNAISLSPHSSHCLQLLNFPMNLWCQFKLDLIEEAYREIAIDAVQTIQITTIQWSQLYSCIIPYIEGVKKVKPEDKDAYDKTIKYFKDNRIPPSEWFGIIKEMDNQIRPIGMNIPISTLVPLVNKEISKLEKK